MANRERNKKILLELVKQQDNSRCADCGTPDPDWASSKLGLFVCLNCSGIHRNLSGRVKSIKLDFWEDELVEVWTSHADYIYRDAMCRSKYPCESRIRLNIYALLSRSEPAKFMKSHGNASARAVYERAIPAYYYQPRQNDCAVLREQWIRAKYERMEFTGETKYPPLSYTTGFYEGILWKKGKENAQFLKRKFVLSEREFTLTYYNKEDESKGPKAVIAIKDLNATFQPEKIGHPHGLQLTYQDNHRTRNLYVYHERAEEIVTWYNAIRAARYAYLKTAYPTGSDEELVPKITRKYLKEGYMEKTGPLQKEPFKRRWFILDSQNRKLLYFKGQLDAEELGAIFIGTEKNGYSVKDCVPRNARGNKWKCGVTMETPERQFIFMCEQEREQREWLEALRLVLSRPMAPQDYTIEANIKCKR